MFTLHPQLAANTFHVADMAYCRVLLMNHGRFPWLILVPMRESLRELFDLDKQDYENAMREVREVSHAFAAMTRADRINVAALGNMVPQLHIHIVARFKDDAAWPNPVWNSGVDMQTYNDTARDEMLATLREMLASVNITKM